MSLLIEGKRKIFTGRINYRLRSILSSTPLDNIGGALEFLNNNCEKPELFLDFIHNPNFLPIVEFTENIHRYDKRKVTGDPYLKHLLYTAYLCFKSSRILKYNENEMRIFIGGALLHDAIEMKKKNHMSLSKEELFRLLKQDGIEDNEAKKIVTVVGFLTPSKKNNSKLTSEEWRAKKRENFNRIMDQGPSEELPLELLEMAKYINIADDAANLRETVEDVKLGNDGPDKEVYDHKPFADRIAVSEERIGKIAKKYPNHPLLFQLKKDLNYLKKRLPSN